MKKFVIVALAVAACFLGTYAHAAVCTMVSVGSSDITPPGVDQNLSMIAMERCDGSIRGQWHDTFGGGASIHIDVTCLLVDGDDAWIGGVIKHTNPPDFGDFAGVPVVTRVRDNGTSANDPADQASFMFVVDDDDECLLKYDFELFDLSNGQVQIK